MICFQIQLAPLHFGRLRLRACAGAIERWRDAVDIHKQERALLNGRRLHSSTFQLNLSRFLHKIHPVYPLIPPDTP